MKNKIVKTCLLVMFMGLFSATRAGRNCEHLIQADVKQLACPASASGVNAARTDLSISPFTFSLINL